MIQLRKYRFYILLSFIYFSSFIFSQTTTRIPDNSKQMIVVIASHQDSSIAFLQKYERLNSKSEWQKLENIFEVIIGKRGLAWGKGLHSVDSKQNVKREGDYKSPEGVFTLSKVFGFSKSNDVQNLKMPYIHITKMLECVDDKTSKYYNKIIERDCVDSVDWSSSEKMIKSKTWYDLGVVVDHNTNEIEKGCGSCIFLHYWEDENDSTSGCTAMSPNEMRKIIYWLDSSLNPVLVQLSEENYVKYKELWKLPEFK